VPNSNSSTERFLQLVRYSTSRYKFSTDPPLCSSCLLNGHRPQSSPLRVAGRAYALPVWAAQAAGGNPSDMRGASQKS